jgi:hypothetical protein
LQLANTVRQQRAEVKRALRAGDECIAELLLAPPEFLQGARLSEILLALPGYGQVRVGRLLKRQELSPMKTVGALSERQRQVLAQALDAV